MAYNGLEIDMLSLGKADCILVTEWEEGRATRVLIDGGNRGSSDKVLAFLKQEDLNIIYIDHLVCSHPHDDHAGGLIGVVKDHSIDIGRAWVHVPEEYVDLSSVELALKNKSDSKTAKIVTKSLNTTNELLSALEGRGISVSQPFAGNIIGFLTVCGPSEDYYRNQVVQFTDERQVETIELSQRVAALKARESNVLLENPSTAPQNNSSTILAAVHNDETYVFTADAGVEALNFARDSYYLDNLTWMQLPHHGSRYNINSDLVSYFSPKEAWVSAPSDSADHPNRAVVNAIKGQGASVFGTHYPSGASIWKHLGDVPLRSTYTESAIPLWDARS